MNQSRPYTKVELSMIVNDRFIKLSGAAKAVLLLMLSKDQDERQYVDGNFVFPVGIAAVYGFSPGVFGRALDDLIGGGFIDLVSTGMGIYKVQNLYRISDRWRNGGKPMRVRGNLGKRGFRPGNCLGAVKSRQDAMRMRAHR